MLGTALKGYGSRRYSHVGWLTHPEPQAAIPYHTHWLLSPAFGLSHITRSPFLLIDHECDSCQHARTHVQVLMGPVLMGPLDRLRLHTYIVLGLMLLTHIICYVVVERTILKEHE